MSGRDFQRLERFPAGLSQGFDRFDQAPRPLARAPDLLRFYRQVFGQQSMQEFPSGLPIFGARQLKRQIALAVQPH